MAQSLVWICSMDTLSGHTAPPGRYNVCEKYYRIEHTQTKLGLNGVWMQNRLHTAPAARSPLHVVAFSPRDVDRIPLHVLALEAS